ncbi:MAG: phosphate/phosphite/phosphonate ABC transporter substrate-binding protein [Geminicoccaceae bacterium]
MRKDASGRPKGAPRSFWLLAFLSALGIMLSPSVSAAEDEAQALPAAYRLGVFPYMPALTIDRLYSPVAEAFSLELNRLVKLRTKTTFENFAAALAEQSYDVIFVHPFLLVDAVEHHGYQPLARLEKPMRAVLAVREDSPASTLDDLVGGTIGLPPKMAAVSKLIKAAMIEAGLRPGLDVGVRHFRNKASCLEAVLSGAVAACGVPAFVLSQIETFDRHALRIAFEAPLISHFAFAVHQRVPNADRQKLQDLILSWSAADDDVVRNLRFDQDFVPVAPQDYVSVRAYQERLQTLALR